MNTDLSKLQPQQLWQNFANICQIPHPSKHEAKIVEFLKAFGENLSLETSVDEVGNIIIKKPATSGMEKCKGVVLQAHVDMVPQKNSGVAHDFETDPINAYIDGEWVTAKDTTLGADNGIGLAAVMAVLQATDIEHGPIEALLTVDEETGMTGAFALKPGMLMGKILINLDSEDEGEFAIGCAGGINTDIEMDYEEVAVPDGVVALEVNVSGLKGGHSGMDINAGRGNANKILARLLRDAKAYDLRLAEFVGGSLRNAIPREAVAIVTVPKAKESEFADYVSAFEQIMKQEIGSVETNIAISVTKTNTPKKLMAAKTQHELLCAIIACMNGVYRMSVEMPGLIETSSNLAKVEAVAGKLYIVTLQRSSIASAKQMIGNMVKCIFELIGATCKQYGDYPGWKPDMNSEILATCKQVYKQKFGKDAKIFATHGGLECGLLKGVYPDWDAISFGPTIMNPHSPDEKVNIASVAKFWEFLVAVLASIPE